MNMLKTITTAVVLLIGTSSGFAQSSVMKDPVSYKLKNGMTVIIAENEATPKVFANLSFEPAAGYAAEKATLQEVVNTLLNQQLVALGAGLSYSEKGVNLATTSANFETAIQSMFACINAPAFDQDALVKAKATVMAHLTAQDKYFPSTVNKTSLAKLSLAEVNAYYQELNNPAHTFLTIAGNITPAIAKSFTKKAMGHQLPIVAINSNYLVSNN
jgi:predicted Zn-dependent peptidase